MMAVTLALLVTIVSALDVWLLRQYRRWTARNRLRGEDRDAEPLTINGNRRVLPRGDGMRVARARGNILLRASENTRLLLYPRGKDER